MALNSFAQVQAFIDQVLEGVMYFSVDILQ
jgi:hypothetical protein